MSRSPIFGRNGQQAGDFRDHAPWWGGDLQTLRNLFLTRQLPLPSQSTTWNPNIHGSGDRLTGTLEEPAAHATKSPMIVLIHGLTGIRGPHLHPGICTLPSDRAVVRSSDLTCVARAPPARLKGLLSRRLRLRHSGCARWTWQYANAAWRFFGRLLPGRQHPSQPPRASQTAPSTHRRGCRFGTDRASTGLPANYGGAECASPSVYSAANETRCSGLSRIIVSGATSIERARSVFAFDDQWVAPRNGFRDAWDYYERTASARHVGAITVPTLMLHAWNDPWLPIKPYLVLKELALPKVEIRLARSGGHVGFHGADTSKRGTMA